MSTLNLLLLLAEAAAASIALPLLAALLARAYPRSASRRRLVWVMMFASLLALPLATIFSPTLAVISLAVPPPGPATVMVPSADLAAAPSTVFSGATGALILALCAWALGALWIVARGLIGLVWLRRLRVDSAPFPPERLPLPLPRGCTVRLSPECPGPMTWGAARPVILLPHDAGDWPHERLEAVLRHELAHVAGRDSLIQALALAACALYWPNPLVWRAARALRQEAEAAADDAVIAAGMRPSDYANLLVDMASAWPSHRRPAFEMAMAAPPILTERVQSILSTKAIRTGATTMDTFKFALMGTAALAALALARPSVAEVAALPSASAEPQVQQASPAASPATAAPPAPAGADIRSRDHDQVAQNTQSPRDKQTAPPVDRTAAPAQKDFVAPPAAAAAAAKAAPGTVVQTPYNQVTDDPASPGYIAPGQPGAGHPVSAELAKLLNARKGGASAPWNLTWLPNPNGPPLPPAPAAAPAPAQPAAPPAATAAPLAPLPPQASAAKPAAQTKISIRLHDSGVGAIQGPGEKETPLSPEQRADLQRKLAEISPKIQKALKDAHIEEAVAKALKDADIEDTVTKALKDARAAGIVAHGRLDLGVDQGQDAPKP